MRDYDPQVGRYVQSDPIGLEGGMNAYSYVDNDVLRYVDPKGLFPFGPGFIGRLLAPPWSPERCAQIQRKIDNLNTDIEKRYALIKQNPLNLPQYGPLSSSPNRASVNGHHREINRLDRDRRKLEKDYDDHCNSNCPPGSPAVDPNLDGIDASGAATALSLLLLGGLVLAL